MAYTDPPVAASGSQLEMFGPAPAPVSAADPDQVRDLLQGLLAEARAAATMPWPPLNAKLYRMLFPQMAACLPEDEGVQLRFAFETELARLDTA
jgi:hypothetical protein